MQIDTFLRPEETDEIESNLTRFVHDVVPTLSDHAAMYQVYGQPETLKQVASLENDAFFSRLLLSVRIQGIAEDLLGEKVAPQGIQFFNKPPRISNT